MSEVSLVDGHIDNGMTNEEIIQALECLGYWGECKQSSQCPYYMDNDIVGGCDNVTIAKEALDLINRYKAENERLKKQNESKFEQWLILDKRTEEKYAKLYEEAKEIVKTEAIKEFAERLKEKSEHFELERENFVSEADIDNLVKEMTDIKE